MSFILRIDYQEGVSVEKEQSFKNNVIKFASAFDVKIDSVVFQRERYEIYKSVMNKLLDAKKVYIRDGVYYIDIVSECSNKSVISYNDFVAGKVVIRTELIKNPIIYDSKKDMFFYNFTSVVDDILLNIKYIIRGNDHIDNTFVQILMMQIIKSICNFESEINFAHIPMCISQSGKISKSSGKNDFTVANIFSNNIFPITLYYYLLFSHLSYKDIEKIILSDFKLELISKKQKNISFEELLDLNKKIIRYIPTDLIISQASKLGYSLTKNVVEIFKFYINSFDDLLIAEKNYAKIYSGNVSDYQKIEYSKFENMDQVEKYNFIGKSLSHIGFGNEYIKLFGDEKIRSICCL